MGIVFRGAIVLTMNPDRAILRPGQVRIEGDRICAVSDQEDLARPGDRLIEAKGKLLMPGLINAHCHAAMSIFRNYGNDVDLDCWLKDYIWPLENQWQSADIYTATLLDIAEMLATGTTCFADMYMEMDQVARAVEDSGIRALLSRGITASGYQEALADQPRFFERWNGAASGRIRTNIATHAVYTATPNSLRAAKRMIDRLGASHHIHLCETQKEVADCQAQYGMSPVALFDRYGLLDEHTIAAHCVWLSEEDIALLKKRGVHPVYNPASNMKLASGFMPLDRLLSEGIAVAIGTDGAASNNKQDLFRDMALGSLIQKGAQLDPLAAPAASLLEMATCNGAKAVGLEAELGSIEPGKKADLILVDFDNLAHSPSPVDVAAGLVYSGAGADVSMTMVDGKILYQDHQFVHLDIEQIKRSCDGILQAMQERRQAHGNRD